MYNGPGKRVTVEQLADPHPGPGELLVRVHRCGLCGSDVAMTHAGPFYLPLGRFGHEWSGEIVETGSGVERLRVGARIAALPVGPCGECNGCATRNPLFCERNGYVVGGFGEYMVIPEQAAIPLPQSLSFGDGALVEPMSCGLHALQFAEMKPTASVLVIGAGAMALSVIFWARRRGATKVAVLSRSARRNEVARNFGADAVFGFDEDGQAQVAELLGGPPDIVAECVGKPGMLQIAVDHVRPRGAIVSLGMCPHGEPIVPAFLTNKEAKLLFPRAYTVEEFELTARAFDAGEIDPQVMVSDLIGLDALPGFLDELHAGTRQALKVHVDPSL
jgi:threonine dehydrogenase-like Zn-dependent dehydrogenase